MKKIILSIVLATIQLAAVAQTVNVHFKNGQVIEYPSDNIDYINFSAKPTDPAVTTGQVVDLGLSVYWATCNLGADSPEELGDEYRWGETKPGTGSQSEYSYYNKETETYINIGNDISGTEYDAATVNQGSDWRMPTATEMAELYTNCTWEWTQINGINGYKVTGKNGNSIFFPKGYYWTATNGYTAEDATALILYSSTYRDIRTTEDRYYSHFIRPISANPNAGIDNIDHTNDYLVTDKISVEFAGGSFYSFGGVLSSGTVNWKIVNNSSEPITLTRLYLKDGDDQSWGLNQLLEDEILAAGESKVYTTELTYGMISPIIVCLKYIYNNKRYSVTTNYDFTNQ